MGLKQFLKNFTLRMDMVSAEPILRANGESAFQTFCGGILSIIIIIAFSIIFYNSFLSVIGKLDISFSQTFDDDPTSSTTISNIMVAIGISGVDLSSAAPTKFYVTLNQNNVMPSGPTSYPIHLSACNKSDWAPLGNNFDKQFEGFKFNKMLCLTKGQTYSLYGYSGGMPYQFLTLTINLCRNPLPGCDTQANSQAQMNSYLASSTNNIFTVRLYIVNTIVSPAKAKPISNMIEKNIIVTFSQTTGTVGYAYIGDFTMSTDSSVLPYTDYSYDSGTFLDTFTTSTVPLGNVLTSNLVQFQFYKSTKSLTIVRTYGKLDALLSYAGGLFSLMFTVIAFFFASYSQYSYEMSIGSKAFSADKNGKKYKEGDFNFCQYLRYCLYDWLCTFGCQPKWQKCEEISQIRQEANNLMSVSHILRRIQHLQNMSQILLEEHKIVSLYLAAPPTLQQAKKFRELVGFYDKLIDRMEEGKAPPLFQSKRITNDQVTKDCLQFNDASFYPNDLTKTADPLFNEEEEIQKQYVNALRELKSQSDEKSMRIKQKIIPNLLDKILDQNSFEKILVKSNNLDYTNYNLNTNGQKL